VPREIAINPPDPQRRQVRAAFRRPAQLVLARQEPHDVRALDLSADGMAVVAPINPPDGTGCVLRFSLPAKRGSATAVVVEAAVVHSLFSGGLGGFHLQLLFKNLSPPALALIQTYVRNSRGLVL
jgi:hypothetical protein